MLATAGGLVFSGGTNDRKFRAFDAASGKVLWEFATNSGVIGQPSSFSGERPAVHRGAVGLGHRRARDAEAADQADAGHAEVPEGGAIWVFALPQ